MQPQRHYRHNVEGAARFLTFSCEQRLPFFSNRKIATLFVQRMSLISGRHRVQILAWVIMPEHIHLVLFPEDPRLENYLVDLKSPFARNIIKRWRELDASILDRIAHAEGLRFWQSGGGYDRTVVGEELLEKIRYTHRNPITRGLCASSVDYEWSSARQYEGAEGIGPPLAFGLLPRNSRTDLI